LRSHTRESRLDRDVRELLRDDPELLALAETIASLRPREVVGAAEARRRRWRSRLLGLGRVILAVARRHSRS
jgi:hypothetical protein